MKKAFLLSLAAGLACGALADAKPPKFEKVNVPITEVSPISVTRVKWAGGKIVADGPPIPYTDLQPRSSMITAVAFDCFGLKPGTAADFPPSPSCPRDCDGPSPYLDYKPFIPNTLDDVVDMACPPGSAVEGIDLAWYQSGPGPIVMVFLMYQDLLDGACPDPATFTATGTGVALTYSSIPPGFWYSSVGGLTALGMKTPSTHVSPSTGFASGCYQWIMASSVSSTAIVLYHDYCNQLLWGTGDAMGQPARPGTQLPVAYDDNNPIDGVFDPLTECSDYSSTCPTALGKMVAFGYLRCRADFNNDGFVDGIDYDRFNTAFESPDPSVQAAADLNGDCFVDGIDYDYFNAQFESLCP